MGWRSDDFAFIFCLVGLSVLVASVIALSGGAPWILTVGIVIGAGLLFAGALIFWLGRDRPPASPEHK